MKLAIEALLEAYEAQWFSPMRPYVLGGARSDERARLGHHFSVIPCRVCDEDDWKRAIVLAWTLHGNGLNIPGMDALIAPLRLMTKCASTPSTTISTTWLSWLRPCSTAWVTAAVTTKLTDKPSSLKVEN